MSGESPSMGNDLAARLWRAGLLGNLHDAAVAVSSCVSGWEPRAFFASTVSLQKVIKCLRIILDSMRDLAEEDRRALPTVDWSRWHALRPALSLVNEEARDAVWLAATEWAPALLMELRRARRQRPDLFSLLPDYDDGTR